jgi:hypothetical protein
VHALGHHRDRWEVEMKTGFQRFVRALMLGAPKKW